MGEFAPVTDQELTRAREDAAYRHKLLTENLEILLAMLNKMRSSSNATNPASAEQIRDGVQLAVKLANIIQASVQNDPPHAA
jgi:hypothetical protein